MIQQNCLLRAYKQIGSCAQHWIHPSCHFSASFLPLLHPPPLLLYLVWWAQWGPIALHCIGSNFTVAEITSADGSIMWSPYNGFQMSAWPSIRQGCETQRRRKQAQHGDLTKSLCAVFPLRCNLFCHSSSFRGYPSDSV